MKKYLKPQIKITKIGLHGMLCVSGNGVYNESAGSGSKGLSRQGGSFWDDDEEDF